MKLKWNPLEDEKDELSRCLIMNKLLMSLDEISALRLKEKKEKKQQKQSESKGVNREYNGVVGGPTRRNRTFKNDKLRVKNVTIKKPPIRLKRCDNCFEQGHLRAKCPYEKICFRCASPEHESKECPHQDKVRALDALKFTEYLTL